MGNKRTEKAITELALIQLQARIKYPQIGYWNRLQYETTDSPFQLQRVMSTQTPEIATKLQAWGDKWIS
jgi:hypothetical protein